MFDPSLGRWITPDPIGFDGEDNNFYRFVGNNPVNRTDPTGLGPTDGAKGAIGAMADKLHWPADKKARIKVDLNKLIDTAQFPWFRMQGAFGKCHEWIWEYYPKVKGMLPIEDIALSKQAWRINAIAGHGAVRIVVSDAPGSNPNNSFTFYLDDGWIGGADHVFVDAEVPAGWDRGPNWSWQGGNESLESCDCATPIGPGTPFEWPPKVDEEKLRNPVTNPYSRLHRLP